MRASLALPLARLDFADEIRDEMGVSDGMSEGEMQRLAGRDERRLAKSASDGDRIIIFSASV